MLELIVGIFIGGIAGFAVCALLTMRAISEKETSFLSEKDSTNNKDK